MPQHLPPKSVEQPDPPADPQKTSCPRGKGLKLTTYICEVAFAVANQLIVKLLADSAPAGTLRGAAMAVAFAVSPTPVTVTAWFVKLVSLKSPELCPVKV